MSKFVTKTYNMSYCLIYRDKSYIFNGVMVLKRSVYNMHLSSYILTKMGEEFI